MDKKAEIKVLIEHPEYLMHAEKMSLEKRMQQKKLDASEVKDAVVDTAKAKSKDVALDVLNGKWGDLILDVMDTGDHLKSKLDDMKKAMLLTEYVQKVDDQEAGLSKLISLITDPYGLSIYSKILSLLSDTPADDEMLDILSEYLVNLTDEDDLRSIFSQTKSILTLIDKSSPQALMLLKHADKWPLIPAPNATISVGGQVQGDNSKQVATEFSKQPIFSDLPITAIQMAIIDLQTNGLAIFIQGTIAGRNDQNGNPEQLFAEKMTETGELIRNAILNRG